MDIGGKLREVDNINKELSLLKERRTELTRRRDALVNELVVYHKQRGVESFEYRGKKYAITEMQKATPKKREQKDRDVMAALETHGLYGNDARAVYQSVVEKIKGVPKVVKTVLK